MIGRGFLWPVTAVCLVAILAAACGGGEEITREEAEERRFVSQSEVLDLTVRKPGGQGFEPGQVGGTWRTSINNDPRSFNKLTARDADTRGVINGLYDYLADYDPYKREFTPNLASFEIEIDEDADELRVIYTLRDDLYWTTPDSDPESWVPVTSDDVVFWYDGIQSERGVQHPAYPGQYIEMADGSRERIEIEKIDDRSFVFHYPRIVQNPILSTNMLFGPRHIYEPALEQEGVQGVLDVLSVDTDPRSIPSLGEYHLIEYEPGQRVVLQRNPNYFKTDENDTSLPYIERLIVRIVPDKNSEFLMFRDGTRDSYTLRPEDLDPLLRAGDRDYTVYDGGATLGASFFTVNQNPGAVPEPKLSWFTQKEFRQALSSLLNRPRIVQQVYRGLAEPAHHFFARPNPMFDEDIRLEYTYNPERAVDLLASIGMQQDAEGVMRDADGNRIEFNISVGAENNIGIDMAQILSDELSEVGINARVRPVDFQRLVEMLQNTYDWDMVSVSLGANYWPSSGSNVWQSSGNFHLWHPLQEEPATEWEARIDYLYNEGRFAKDEERAKEIYDEYQQILLEQLPFIYTVHPMSFQAVRDRWGNVFYDTLRGLDTTYVYLKD